MRSIEVPPVRPATAADFETLALAPRDELVVVEFWGRGCANCDVFAADRTTLLEALAGERVQVVTVDASREEALARRFGLVGVPTFLLFRDGRLLGRISGYPGRAAWLVAVRAHLPERA